MLSLLDAVCLVLLVRKLCVFSLFVPRLRWINDVEDDLRKLGVKRWRTKAVEREEWASIINEAKAKLKGP